MVLIFNSVDDIKLDSTGKTDCSATLQTFIAKYPAGNYEITFSKGTYLFTSTVTFANLGNVKIGGMDSPIINFVSSTDSSLFIFNNASASWLMWINFYSKSLVTKTMSNSFITITNSNNFTISGCNFYVNQTFANNGSLVYVSGGSNVYIQSNYLSGNGLYLYGVNGKSTDTLSVLYNTIYSIMGPAVNATGTDDVIISNNTCKLCSLNFSSSICTNGLARGSISHNTIVGNELNYGILINTNTTSSGITFNDVSGCSNGIMICSASGNTIENNCIHNNNIGIEANNHSNTIVNNVCYDNNDNSIVYI